MTFRYGTWVAAAVIAAFVSFGATASAQPSKLMICKSCHTLEEGAGHLAGPNLFEFCKRKIGSAERFTYSPDMKASGEYWTTELLDAFLKTPRAVFPRTRMMIGAPADDVARAELIAEFLLATGCAADDLAADPAE